MVVRRKRVLRVSGRPSSSRKHLRLRNAGGWPARPKETTMTPSEEPRNRITRMDVCMAIAALASAMLLLFAATQSQAQTFTVLHTFSFGGLDGSFPAAGVTLDAAGRVYGTTYEGGPNS